MPEKLKISQGWTILNSDGSPRARDIFERQATSVDVNVTVVLTTTFNLLAAVAKAAIEHHDDYEFDRDFIDQVVKDGDLSEAHGKLLVAVHDLRAHLAECG